MHRGSTSVINSRCANFVTMDVHFYEWGGFPLCILGDLKKEELKKIENSFFLHRPLQNDDEIMLHVPRLTPLLKKFVVYLLL